MPHCYIKLSSSPRETAAHVTQCLRETGGSGQLRLLATDGDQVYALVAYEKTEIASGYLERITACLGDKGHEIHEAVVLEDLYAEEDTPHQGA